MFIEFGPRNILTNLVKNILADRPHLAVALNMGKKKDSDRQLREAVAQLRVAGLLLREIDPFAAISKPVEIKPKRALNIQLNGSNYVSDRTRLAYTTALQQPTPVDESPALNMVPAAPVPQPTATVATAPHADVIAQFVQQQAEAARIHEEYLRQHAEQTQALLKLIGDGTPLPAGLTLAPASQSRKPNHYTADACSCNSCTRCSEANYSSPCACCRCHLQC